MTPMQRTLRYYHGQLFISPFTGDSAYAACEVVEKKIPKTNRTKDLFGFADLIAFGGGQAVLIQSTTGSNFSARDKKIRGSELAKQWIMNNYSLAMITRCEAAVFEIHLIAWRKLKRTGRWEPRIKRYTKEDFK